MKRRKIVFVALVAAICMSAPVFAAPDWVDEGRTNLLNGGSLAGAGVSNIRNTRQARRAARLDAETDIVRTLENAVKISVREAADTILANIDDFEFDSNLEIYTSKASSKAKAILKGARIVKELRSTDGSNEYWILMEIPASVYQAQLEDAVKSVVSDLQPDIESAVQQQPAETRPDLAALQNELYNQALQQIGEAIGTAFTNR